MPIGQCCQPVLGHLKGGSPVGLDTSPCGSLQPTHVILLRQNNTVVRHDYMVGFIATNPARPHGGPPISTLRCGVLLTTSQVGAGDQVRKSPSGCFNVRDFIPATGTVQFVLDLSPALSTLPSSELTVLEAPPTAVLPSTCRSTLIFCEVSRNAFGFVLFSIHRTNDGKEAVSCPLMSGARSAVVKNPAQAGKAWGQPP